MILPWIIPPSVVMPRAGGTSSNHRKALCLLDRPLARAMPPGVGRFVKGIRRLRCVRRGGRSQPGARRGCGRRRSSLFPARSRPRSGRRNAPGSAGRSAVRARCPAACRSACCRPAGSARRSCSWSCSRDADAVVAARRRAARRPRSAPSMATRPSSLVAELHRIRDQIDDHLGQAVARRRRPVGRSVGDVGLEPDHVVACANRPRGGGERLLDHRRRRDARPSASRVLPASILARSRMSLMSRVSRSLSCTMMRRNSLRCSTSRSGLSCTISLNERIEVSGVRSSWLTVETKSSFSLSSSLSRSLAARSSSVAASSSATFPRAGGCRPRAARPRRGSA